VSHVSTRDYFDATQCYFSFGFLVIVLVIVSQYNVFFVIVTVIINYNWIFLVKVIVFTFFSYYLVYSFT